MSAAAPSSAAPTLRDRNASTTSAIAKAAVLWSLGNACPGWWAMSGRTCGWVVNGRASGWIAAASSPSA